MEFKAMPDSEIFDRSRLVELMSVLDMATVQRLVTMLELNCREFAGNFQRAIESGDVVAAQAQAHKLAGALSQYGLVALAREFRELEREALGTIASALPRLTARLSRELAALPDYVSRLGGETAID